MKIGFFAGTFDPFTNGHYEIVKKSLCVCDKVIIGLGDNKDKKRAYDKNLMATAIRKTFANETKSGKIEVYTYSGLTGEFAKKINASFLIRGIRDVKDFLFEKDVAYFNLTAFNIETIYLHIDDATHISSSLVKEMIKNDLCVNNLLPKSIFQFIQTQQIKDKE